MSRSCSLLALLLVLAPLAAPAQQYQLGWSITTSQGRGGSTSATQTIRASAANPGVQLSNVTTTDQNGVYRLLDPSQPFLVLESSETSVTTTNESSGGFSTFTGFGASVFHSP